MTRAECFLDTNILIHFKSPHELDWLALTGADEVVLTIPATVIHELDEKKELGKSARLRKRAQDALRRLNHWSQQGDRAAIRDRVTLRLVAEEPMADWAALHLDAHVSDDRVIAAALTQRISSDCPVFLVTADFGPRLKCKARRIPVITPPDEYRQPDLMAEQDQELAQLRRRLAEFEAREPQLGLELVGSFGRGPRLELEIGVPALTTDDEIETAVKEEERDLNAMLVSRSDAPSIHSLFSTAVGPEEENRFRQAIPDYLVKYQAYLQDMRRYELNAALTAKLQCVLVNSGHAVAQGIHVVLHVPDGPIVFDEEAAPRPPQRPDRPAPPRTQAELVRDTLTFSMPTDLIRPYASLIRMPDIARESLAPRITKTDSHLVEYTHQELQHGFEVVFEPFFCTFRGIDAVSSFSIDYDIHAKNLAHPSTGRLDVILRVESTSFT